MKKVRKKAKKNSEKANAKSDDVTAFLAERPVDATQSAGDVSCLVGRQPKESPRGLGKNKSSPRLSLDITSVKLGEHSTLAKSKVEIKRSDVTTNKCLTSSSAYRFFRKPSTADVVDEGVLPVAVGEKTPRGDKPYEA